MTPPNPSPALASIASHVSLRAVSLRTAQKLLVDNLMKWLLILSPVLVALAAWLLYTEEGAIAVAKVTGRARIPKLDPKAANLFDFLRK